MRRIAGLVLLAVLAIPATLPGPLGAQTGDDHPDASFGFYPAASRLPFPSWQRSSRYLTMRDGVKLAADVLRPVREDGTVVEDPLPAIWMLTRSPRAWEGEDGVVSVVDRAMPLQRLVRSGYVMVVVETRGSGASFGIDVGPFSLDQARHAYEVTEWVAAQPWCDGNVGMVGRGYAADAQLIAASAAPPSLRAIFPNMPSFDLYALYNRGGIFLERGIRALDQSLRETDASPAVPVDEDRSGAQLARALARRDENLYPEDYLPPVRFRDSAGGIWSYLVRNPTALLPRVERAEVPVYLWGGWMDMAARDVFQWYANLEASHRLAVGPWSRVVRGGETRAEYEELLATEQLRWFDHWLKGVDTGVLEAPPIWYAVTREPGDWIWRSAGSWPPERSDARPWYLEGGPSGSAASVNDGRLVPDTPATRGIDSLVVDYRASSGRQSRWPPAYSDAYGDLSSNDARGLTYTTDPLEAPLTLTGHPVVTLWVASSAEDQDVFAYLEEVTPQGASRYLTEGALRASHRATADPPFDNLGLPWHRSFERDVRPLDPGEPVELAFDLLPTAAVIDAGHRLRLTITGADAGIASVERRDPPPTLTLLRDPDRPSRILLPIVH